MVLIADAGGRAVRKSGRLALRAWASRL